jgi:hypothetical protein
MTIESQGKLAEPERPEEPGQSGPVVIPAATSPVGVCACRGLLVS